MFGDVLFYIEKLPFMRISATDTALKSHRLCVRDAKLLPILRNAAPEYALSLWSAASTATCS